MVQALPLYSCSTDNVPMISMATTPEGRIFTGGQNGGVYEIVYSSRDTWRQKRMYKVRQKLLALYMTLECTLVQFLPHLLHAPQQGRTCQALQTYSSSLQFSGCKCVVHPSCDLHRQD